MPAMLNSVYTSDDFRTGLSEALTDLNEAWALGEQTARPGEATPPVLSEAFDNLF